MQDHFLWLVEMGTNSCWSRQKDKPIWFVADAANHNMNIYYLSGLYVKYVLHTNASVSFLLLF